MKAHRLDRFEQFRWHDVKLGNLLLEPLVARVFARLALARFRVLYEALAIEDNTTGVKAVIQDSVLPLAAPDQCRRVPWPPSGGRDALAVQGLDDLDWRSTAGVFLKNPTHDRGLGLVYFALAALVDRRHDVIAVALAARYAALFDPSNLAALRLERQVVEKHARNHAFEADVHFPD
ncbi:hypothetical protein [Hyphomicrobium sp. ghe19]|uniref:hypothetical protein n=1 Tax=Hyphomicrobium sp. ghe19 TaxID=2682968 RepID=UPI0030D109ED